MRLAPYLCIAGTEIANMARTTSYGEHCLFTSCPCAALDGDFDTPATDPAPWYDAAVAESGDFLGFLPETITLSPPYLRSTRSANVGTAIGGEKLNGQVVEARGWMIARTEAAMFYGQRWLTEALRGSYCAEGCVSDEMTLLPFCRESGTAEELALDFRRLVSAAAVQAPVFNEIDADDEWVICGAQFQIATTMPWLLTPVDEVSDLLYTTVDLSLTTREWGEGTFRIELTNGGTDDATGIVIQGQLSLDGSCPVTGDGLSVPPSWTYTVPTLGPDERIVIDGTRRQVLHYDPSDKYWSAGLSWLEVPSGPLRWPDVGACSTMCLSITSDPSDVTATVTAYQREV